MILTCPNCATRYLVDDTKIGASGRRVRCAKCASEWMSDPAPAGTAAAAPAAAPPPPVDPAPAVTAPFIDSPAEPARPRAGLGRPAPTVVNLPALRRPPRRAAGVGWLALVVLVLLLLLGLLFGREQIMAALPQTKTAYAAIGLAELEPPFTLDFDVAKGRASFTDGGKTLLIEGEIVNLGKTAQQVPPIRMELRDAAGLEVGNWTFDAPVAELAPGARAPFSTRRESPPEGARGFKASFVSRPGS